MPRGVGRLKSSMMKVSKDALEMKEKIFKPLWKRTLPKISQDFPLLKDVKDN